jgi:N-acetylglucosamine kinase-like BadF-type ATPase
LSPALDPEQLVVGVDVGGTKAAVHATTVEGVIVVDKVISAAEWDAEPVASAVEWLTAALTTALPEGSTVGALVIGAQGLDNADVINDLESALHQHGYEHVRCVNDAALIVPAGGLEEGMALISGTGAIGVGVDAERRPVTAGGWGWILGDDAGAAGIVREATKAALLAHDNGEPDDGLLAELLRDFGVSNAERLARRVNDDPTMANWAPHAPAGCCAADAGSTQADQVVRRAADHLVLLVDQLVRKGAEGKVVVAAGGVITHQPRLSAYVDEALASHHPQLQLLILKQPPVVGAWILALRLWQATHGAPLGESRTSAE